MAQATIEITADLLVSVRFTFDVEDSRTLADIHRNARDAAVRMADRVTNKGEHTTATVQRVIAFSSKLSTGPTP